MTVLVIGTCDTKGPELAFLKERIAAAGVPARLVDVSTGAAVAPVPVDVTADRVLASLSIGAAPVDRKDRGAAVGEMSRALVMWISAQTGISGVLGIGGSGGTALVAPAFQALPIGLPKLIVSTVASGNVAPYVGSSDITMMYSVADLSGLNRISRPILTNAAAAIAAMARADRTVDVGRAAIGLTMFGVTTPCVTAVMDSLSASHDTLVFHATGTGGQAFEKLVDSRLVALGLDVTTTEVADYIVGGVFACTSDRFGAFIRTGLPWVGSVGALDMVNFGAFDSVPATFRSRNLYAHNANVTLMRTTSDDCARIGAFIGERLGQCSGPVRLVIPERGISAIDAPGKPFHDPEANRVLFDEIERSLAPAANRSVERLPYHINDPEFAAALVARARPFL